MHKVLSAKTCQKLRFTISYPQQGIAKELKLAKTVSENDEELSFYSFEKRVWLPHGGMSNTNQVSLFFCYKDRGNS